MYKEWMGKMPLSRPGIFDDYDLEYDFLFLIEFSNGRYVTVRDLHDEMNGENYDLRFIHRDDAIRTARRLLTEYHQAGIEMQLSIVAYMPSRGRVHCKESVRLNN